MAEESGGALVGAPVGELASCHCCGLVMTYRPPGRGESARCARCRTRLRHGPEERSRARASNRWAACWALSALILFPAAVLLPIVRIEQLGRYREDSIVSGVATLLHEGELLVAGVIVTFSMILPPLKLLLILLLAARTPIEGRHKSIVYRAIEALGKWGMLDVLLVALLVAFIKLRDLIEFAGGPGLVAFALCVLMSLFAAAAFDPHSLWEEESR